MVLTTFLAEKIFIIRETLNKYDLKHFLRCIWKLEKHKLLTSEEFMLIFFIKLLGNIKM